MKTLKQFISILLLISLLAALLCGCGGKDKDNAGSKDTNSESREEEVRLEKLPDFDPLDWSAVEDAPAEDFTYEILNAYDPTVDEWADVIKLLSYSGDDNIVKIPDMIDGYCVRFASPELFRGNTTITHVYLPTYMAFPYETEYFFRDCTSLLQVQMPKNCNRIPYGMFYDCTALREVTFTTTEGDTSSSSWVHGYAFSGCTSLTHIDLPEYITEIENGAFNDCVRLEEIKLDSVERIGEHAFDGCISLEKASLASAKYVSYEVFRGCTALKEITLDSAVSIGNRAFEGCTNLKTVTAPKAYSIGNYAFLDCAKLSELTICEYSQTYANDDKPGTVFNGCNSLKTISFAPYEGEDQDNVLVLEDGILYSVFENADGSTSAEMMCILPYYRDKKITLRSDTRVIRPYAFNNVEFKTFEIPASVLEVSKHAFYECPNLQKITEEKGSDYVYWSDEAFAECPKLEILDFSARPWEYMNRSEKTFYDYYSCQAVEKVVFPGEDPDAKPLTKADITAAIDAALAEYAEEMEDAGFTYEITCKNDKLNQVMLYTNKENVSSSDGALLKKLTFAVIQVPESGLDQGLIDELQYNDFTGFDYLNRYFVGSDKLEFGYWADKGCLILLTNF